MPYKDPTINKLKAKERAKRWSEKFPDKANANARAWRQRNPKYMLHVSAKRRAAAKGLEFNISVGDIPDIPNICPVALIPIRSRNDGTRGPCDNSPTLDRHDPSKGYIIGNVRVISHRANRWKGEMTLEELERLMEYMKNG